MTKEKSLQISVLEKLRDVLSSFRIPIELWGIGEAKTIQHLLDETTREECVLIEKDGELLRKVVVVSLDVYYEKNGELYLLVEDKQVFNDGRERRRGLGWSVSEKMTPDESPLSAAKRAILEELGIGDKLHIESEEVIVNEKASPSYPGLTSRYERHHFKVGLNDKQYNPIGYVEEQKDKKTSFIWRKQ